MAPTCRLAPWQPDEEAAVAVSGKPQLLTWPATGQSNAKASALDGYFDQNGSHHLELR